jgi:hypothetical protein
MRNTMARVATDVRGANLPGAGHFVLEECPAEVAAVLSSFVREAGPGAEAGSSRRPPQARGAGADITVHPAARGTR